MNITAITIIYYRIEKYNSFVDFFSYCFINYTNFRAKSVRFSTHSAKHYTLLPFPLTLFHIFVAGYKQPIYLLRKENFAYIPKGLPDFTGNPFIFVRPELTGLKPFCLFNHIDVACQRNVCSTQYNIVSATGQFTCIYIQCVRSVCRAVE